MRQCECGCGEWFEPSGKRGDPTRYIPGHQFRVPETRAKRDTAVRARRVPPPPDFPTDGLCRCGCGQRTSIATTTHRRLNHYRGYHVPYVRGHSGAKAKNRPPADKKPIKINGYVYVYQPDHPRARAIKAFEGYVPEHTVVWEQHHGRMLPPGKQIRHRNGIKDDNRPENLIGPGQE